MPDVHYLCSPEESAAMATPSEDSLDELETASQTTIDLHLPDEEEYALPNFQQFLNEIKESMKNGHLDVIEIDEFKNMHEYLKTLKDHDSISAKYEKLCKKLPSMKLIAHMHMMAMHIIKNDGRITYDCPDHPDFRRKYGSSAKRSAPLLKHLRDCHSELWETYVSENKLLAALTCVKKCVLNSGMNFKSFSCTRDVEHASDCQFHGNKIIDIRGSGNLTCIRDRLGAETLGDIACRKRDKENSLSGRRYLPVNSVNPVPTAVTESHGGPRITGVFSRRPHLEETVTEHAENTLLVSRNPSTLIAPAASVAHNSVAVTFCEPMPRESILTNGESSLSVAVDPDEDLSNVLSNVISTGSSSARGRVLVENNGNSAAKDAVDIMASVARNPALTIFAVGNERGHTASPTNAVSNVSCVAAPPSTRNNPLTRTCDMNDQRNNLREPVEAVTSEPGAGTSNLGRAIKFKLGAKTSTPNKAAKIAATPSTRNNPLTRTCDVNNQRNKLRELVEAVTSQPDAGTSNLERTTKFKPGAKTSTPNKATKIAATTSTRNNPLTRTCDVNNQRNNLREPVEAVTSKPGAGTSNLKRVAATFRPGAETSTPNKRAKVMTGEPVARTSNAKKKSVDDITSAGPKRKLADGIGTDPTSRPSTSRATPSSVEPPWDLEDECTTYMMTENGDRSAVPARGNNHSAEQRMINKRKSADIAETKNSNFARKHFKKNALGDDSIEEQARTLRAGYLRTFAPTTTTNCVPKVHSVVQQYSSKKISLAEASKVCAELGVDLSKYRRFEDDAVFHLQSTKRPAEYARKMKLNEKYTARFVEALVRIVPNREFIALLQQMSINFAKLITHYTVMECNKSRKRTLVKENLIETIALLDSCALIDVRNVAKRTSIYNSNEKYLTYEFLWPALPMMRHIKSYYFDNMLVPATSVRGILNNCFGRKDGMLLCLLGTNFAPCFVTELQHVVLRFRTMTCLALADRLRFVETPSVLTAEHLDNCIDETFFDLHDAPHLARLAYRKRRESKMKNYLTDEVFASIRRSSRRTM